MRRMATPTSKAPTFRPSPCPSCRRCGGVLKPDVVFFGENVPRDRVDAAQRHLMRADAMLIVGSSLMVYSGFRFVQWAAERRKAGRRGQPRPDPRRRAHRVEGRAGVRGRAGFSLVIVKSLVRRA